MNTMSQQTTNPSYETECKWCGEKLIQPEGICPKCDATDSKEKSGESADSVKRFSEAVGISTASIGASGGYDWLTTFLLCFFVGFLGIHRFYTGHMMVGFLQLATLGGCGMWSMTDFLTIATGTYRDSQDRPLVKKKYTFGQK